NAGCSTAAKGPVSRAGSEGVCPWRSAGRVGPASLRSQLLLTARGDKRLSALAVPVLASSTRLCVFREDCRHLFPADFFIFPLAEGRAFSYRVNSANAIPISGAGPDPGTPAQKCRLGCRRNWCVNKD